MNKKLFASLALVLLSGLAKAGVNIEHWTTPNGARVYFVATQALPILDVQIDFPSGSARDPMGKSGLAGLTRGLLDAGVAGLDEEAIAGRIADLGIIFGGGVDSDRTSITLRTLSAKPRREGGLALLTSLLTTPTFAAEVVAREKARAIAAIAEAATRPESIIDKRFSAALYPDHPYGRSATVESVSKITRDDIVAFQRNNYVAKGAVLSLIGAITRAEAESIALALTSALPTATAAGEAQTAIPPVTLPTQSVIHVAHPSAQAHIYLGMPAVKRSDPEYYALLVGNYALGGGGFVSRLMKEVREKRGYAYSVYSYFAPRKLEGPFQIGLQTRREQANDALKVVNEVFDGFLKSGPTDEELKAAKQNIVDGLALRIDSNAKLLGYLSAIGFYDLPLNYLDDYPRLINSVTAAQVRAAFASHVKKENLVTVIVGGDEQK